MHPRNELRLTATDRSVVMADHVLPPIQTAYSAAHVGLKLGDNAALRAHRAELLSALGVRR